MEYLKIILWVMLLVAAYFLGVIADYFGHWICVKMFKQKHFEWCDRKSQCPVIHLKEL